VTLGLRRKTRTGRLVVAAALVVQALLWVTTAAAAAAGAATTTTLTQSADTVAYGSEGSDLFSMTVTGTGAAAPTGTVTVADSASGTTICAAPLETGTGDTSTATCSPADTALATGTAFTTVVATYGGDSVNAGSASSPGQTFTVTATITSTLPPAPSGFATTVVAVYQSVYTTAQTLGSVSGLMPVSQYQQQIQNMAPSDLAALYYATQQVPEWDQLPALMQTIATGAGTPPPNLSTYRVEAPLVGKGGRAPARAVLASVDFPAPSSSAPRQAVLTANQANVAPYQPQNCPVGPSDGAVFAATIAIDVSYAAYNAFSSLTNLPLAIGDVFSALSVVAAAVELAAQIVHDALAFEQQLANDCANNVESGYVANIDNTTVATYGLVVQVNATITALTTTDGTTQQEVQAVQTQLTALSATLQQTLASDTAAIQATMASNTQSTSTELQTIQSALAQDVTTIDSAQAAVGHGVSAEVDTDSSAIQTALATALSQSLHETDADAQQLTTLVTQGNQKIINTVNADFATAQQQYEEKLELEIEQGLAGWGPVVPTVQFVLPAVDGGFLNATPVGVQEVVTTDIADLQAIGVNIKAAAVTDLSDANADLATGQYLAAWSYYQQAYQLIA